MKQSFEKFLKDNDFLPYSNWDSFPLSHEIPKDETEANRNFKEIKNKVNRKSGLYVYEKDGRILYVGKARSLFGRIKSHYIESYIEVSGDTKKKSKFGANLWHRFFSENRGMVTIYWKELKEEKERQIIEKMLELVLLQSIEFEEFKRKCKEGN